MNRDPQCRFALADPDLHVCRRNTGEPIRAGESCFFEARAELLSDHRTKVDEDRAIARYRWLMGRAS